MAAYVCRVLIVFFSATRVLLYEQATRSKRKRAEPTASIPFEADPIMVEDVPAPRAAKLKPRGRRAVVAKVWFVRSESVLANWLRVKCIVVQS